MIDTTNIRIGDYVQFLYRKDSSVKLNGCVVSILNNTIVVDVTEMIKLEEYGVEEMKHVVKHGCYNKIKKSS
ncbi:DUF2187 domain-containing protein [Bacillus cereus]|nr:DUF2187 domain-containing protein [Bacillus cereus]